MAEPFATSEIRHHFMWSFREDLHEKYAAAFDAWLAAHDLEQKTKGFMLGWTAARVEPEHAAATHSRGFARMRASASNGGDS